mmetsp:Transcript_68779/g.157804  ORF Transcript_68779/g.157804 Transcript_68779/m.157804 type:complete len:147 (+) Transcript_68779:59-499(+)
MSSNDAKVHQFETQSIGYNRYYLTPSNPELNSMFLLVRQLQGRWIGVMKINGQLVASHYWWAKIKSSFWVPTGVEYVVVHGFAIKDCKIDYQHKLQKTIQSGDKWEMERGDDPIWGCPDSGAAVVDFNEGNATAAEPEDVLVDALI